MGPKNGGYASQLSTSQLRAIVIAFVNGQRSQSTSMKRLHNRYFHCWSGGCFVRACQKPREDLRIKRDFDYWNWLRCLSARAMHYSHLSRIPIDQDERMKPLNHQWWQKKHPVKIISNPKVNVDSNKIQGIGFLSVACRIRNARAIKKGY